MASQTPTHLFAAGLSSQVVVGSWLDHGPRKRCDNCFSVGEHWHSASPDAEWLCEEGFFTEWKQGNTPYKKPRNPAFGGVFFCLMILRCPEFEHNLIGWIQSEPLVVDHGSKKTSGFSSRSLSPFCQQLDAAGQRILHLSICVCNDAHPLLNSSNFSPWPFAQRFCLSSLNSKEAIGMAAKMDLHWTATAYHWIGPGHDHSTIRSTVVHHQS